MFRLWGKIMKDNRLERDTEYRTIDYSKSRTQMVLDGVDQICREFDLANPIWLEKTIQEFKYHDKARFTQDNFIEPLEFDYLEIQVLEE
ncbi:MAG: hypothetical protein LIV11_10955 [Bacillota bacterium]|uniref:Uncharacterized protein n=1 Tax=[Clostridium] aminophilum TaxID=1526 RepID=A0A1I0HIU1_9FIRM|nr:hypothetical protein [[Clostridium] aminophilum]MCR4628685.1 hypothetical protein [Clostridium sp.]MDT3845066.1 hypothetical protein [Bacillota bacterium]SET83754.1 hypothetical protein SAMN04487771_10519 [[Clostridium] aminophilum]SFR83380.1 hypothetical protein SAMN02910262_02033 [[Clostridium] aminophilum]